MNFTDYQAKYLAYELTRRCPSACFLSVVHDDAALVHAMEDLNGEVSRNQTASGLQEKATRQFICDVMEGGAIGFRKLFDRMGREEI